MPNGNIHKTAGAILVPITYLTIQNNSQQNNKVDIGELILLFGAGVGTSRIPDMLEPATNHNHRAFFHSITFAGIVSIIGVRAWNDLKVKRSERKTMEIQQWNKYEFIDIAIIIAAGSILLHLVMDGLTKKGLPFI